MNTKPLLAIIVFLISGVSGSWWMAQWLKDSETRVIEASFENDVARHTAALEREILLNLEILFSIKGALDVLPVLTEESFDVLTRDVLARTSAIQAFAWAPRVVHEARAQFELERQSDIPGFAITARSPTDAVVPAPVAPEYYPVYYIEPLRDNQAALGFDLSTEARRRAALLAARDQGEMVATAGIRLVQETSDQVGFLVFTPVYSGRPTDLASRRRELIGFFNGVFRLGDMFASAIETTDLDTMYLRLVDRTNGQNEVLLESGSLDDGQYSMTNAYRHTLSPIAGRQWEIQAVPNNAYVSSQRSWVPQMTLGGGLIITLLLSSYGLMVLRKNSQLKRAKDELEQISLTDGLTGVANRRHFDQHLDEQWQLSVRELGAISLLIIDIDHFKNFNDQFGHQAGDECLMKVARALNTVIKRPTDLVARYGGEEFAVILPNTTRADELAEACRERVEALRIENPRHGVKSVLTVSVGVSTMEPHRGSEFTDLIASADRALYRAKSSGRNRVEVA
ncbi:diguanylate cyclase [Salinispirillum marinum]|uniref:diguanylate cyclase n=2 Tax=Saccharospirillaceae TaxID=255527 RepID=A0ABV8BCS4_9GAMM